MTLRHRTLAWLLGLGLPILAILIVAVVWGGDLLIPLVAARAGAALGRPVSIAHLHIVPGRIVTVTADDVTIGNPPDWTGEPLARLPYLRVQVDIWDYLRRRELVVPLVEFGRPQVSATQLPNGAANYKLQLASNSSGSSTKLGEVRINDGQVFVRLAKLKADLTIGIATQNQGEQAQIVANVKGTYNAQPITGQMIGGALLALRDSTHPWPIELSVQNGATQVSLNGTVSNPLAMQGADLKLHFAGPDMSLLTPLTGIPVPKTPDYELTGGLDFAKDLIQLRDLAARVGSTDLEGIIEVNSSAEPPEMTANLRSRRVDLADLGAFIGTEPGRTSTPGETPAQRAQLAHAESSPKLIPDTPISVPKLRFANVHLQYLGQSIEGRSVPLDNLEVKLDIVNGQVEVHPLSFGVGTGRINGQIELTPEGNQTHAKADIEFQRVDVSRLMAATHAFHGAGTISGSAALDGTGNSIAQILDNGKGELKLAMVGGDLSAILIDLSGLEFGNAVLSALGMPQRTQVQCFVTDAPIRGGVLQLQPLILDTGEAIVTGSGGANLRDETLDLHIKTEAKHFSIGSLPTPFNIGGTLKHPSILPGAELAVRGGLAAGLAAIFPPLAALPTIQFGTGDDHRCDRVLAQAKQHPGGERLPQPGPRESAR
jgi:AsmA family protein